MKDINETYALNALILKHMKVLNETYALNALIWKCTISNIICALNALIKNHNDDKGFCLTHQLEYVHSMYS